MALKTVIAGTSLDISRRMSGKYVPGADIRPKDHHGRSCGHDPESTYCSYPEWFQVWTGIEPDHIHTDYDLSAIFPVIDKEAL